MPRDWDLRFDELTLAEYCEATGAVLNNTKGWPEPMSILDFGMTLNANFGQEYAKALMDQLVWRYVK